MNKHKNKHIGFHHVGLMVSEFFITGLIVSFLTSFTFLLMGLIALSTTVALTFAVKTAIRIWRQLPNILGYGDLTVAKTKKTTQHIIITPAPKRASSRLMV